MHSLKLPFWLILNFKVNNILINGKYTYLSFVANSTNKKQSEINSGF